MSVLVQALGVSVEIELKMDWQRCKKFKFCNYQSMELTQC